MRVKFVSLVIHKLWVYMHKHLTQAIHAYCTTPVSAVDSVAVPTSELVVTSLSGKDTLTIAE